MHFGRQLSLSSIACSSSMHKYNYGDPSKVGAQGKSLPPLPPLLAALYKGNKHRQVFPAIIGYCFKPNSLAIGEEQCPTHRALSMLPLLIVYFLWTNAYSNSYTVDPHISKVDGTN